jgi:hypothetical protein
MAQKTARHLEVALCGLLTVLACEQTPRPEAVDAAVPDAAAPQVSGASDGPAATRDLPPFERPPMAPPPTGHGWLVRDIGAAGGGTGRLQVAPQGLLMTGGGTEIGGAADSFLFVYRKMKGDGEIVARPRSVQRADVRSTAGVMFRADDADPAAANVFLGMLADPSLGGQSVHRSGAGQMAVASVPDPQARSQYLRIRREGRRFTMARSADRIAWVKMGAVEIDMPDEISVGLALTARSGTLSTAAEFDFARLLFADPPARQEAWELEPLGIAGPLATATLEGNKLSMSAVGDLFTTTWENGAALLAPRSADLGSLSITVRVEALGDAKTPDARLALTFREGGTARLNPTSRNILVSVTGRGVVEFQRRDRSTNFEPGMTRAGLTLPIWLRLTRNDDPTSGKTVVTGFHSMDGTAWTALDSAEFSIPDPTLAGVIFTSGSVSSYANAVVTNLSITAGPPAPSPDAGGRDGGSPDGGGPGMGPMGGP